MSNRIKCPNCNILTEADAFCEHCGSELNINAETSVDKSPPNQSQSEQTSSSSPDDRQPQKDSEKAKPEGKQSYSEEKQAPEAGETAPEQAENTSADASSASVSRMVADSDCPDVRVEIDESTILAEGMVSTFRVQLTNLGECMNAVRMVLSTKDPVSNTWKSSNYSFPGRSRIPKNKTSEAGIAFKPDSYGLQPFRCRLSFKRRGRRYTYETDDTVHTVYQETDEPGQVINQVINNIENKGHAADVPVNNTVDFYRGMEHSTSINQIIQKANRAPRAWIPLSLYEADIEDETKVIIPATKPPNTAKTDRITLQTSSFRIHLLAGETITLGRCREKNGARANDIVTRIFHNDKPGQAASQKKISRYHCYIQKKGDTVAVVDQGLTPEGEPHDNLGGTFIDGEAIPAGRASKLPLNHEFVLSLAAADAAGTDTFALRCQSMGCDLWNQPESCPSPGSCGKYTPVSMVMHRFDDLKEIFILLWGHLRLSVADPALGRLGVVRVADAFSLYGDFPPIWLNPGQDIRLSDGEEISVRKEQSQCGMATGKKPKHKV